MASSPLSYLDLFSYKSISTLRFLTAFVGSHSLSNRICETAVHSFCLATKKSKDVCRFCFRMAHSVSLISIDLNSLVLNHQWQSFAPSQYKRRYATSIRAVQETQGPRRLVDIIRALPQVSRNYFKKPSRRTLFGGISLLGGFYVAQTISLSFGALGVNDVIASVLCVILTEYVTRFYYTRPTVTFPLALLNNFKMGFTYGLFIDAFKLAS